MQTFSGLSGRRASFVARNVESGASSSLRCTAPVAQKWAVNQRTPCPQHTTSNGRGWRTCRVAAAEAAEDFVYVSVAGPPSREAPQLLIPDPLKAHASLVRVPEQQQQLETLPERGLSKRQYREQAAIIQAQEQEIHELRAALARTQDAGHSANHEHADVVRRKDEQLAQLYALAAEAARERAAMRQQVADMELELQITKQQLYAVVDNLVHLKSSMGEDVLPGLDTGTWTYTTDPQHELVGNNDAIMQLHQLHQLGRSLMDDLHRDEGLIYNLGLEGILGDDGSEQYDSYDGDDGNNGAAYNGTNNGYWSGNGNGNGNGWGN